MSSLDSEDFSNNWAKEKSKQKSGKTEQKVGMKSKKFKKTAFKFGFIPNSERSAVQQFAFP
jgi:hypothetical protein